MRSTPPSAPSPPRRFRCRPPCCCCSAAAASSSLFTRRRKNGCAPRPLRPRLRARPVRPCLRPWRSPPARAGRDHHRQGDRVQRLPRQPAIARRFLDGDGFGWCGRTRDGYVSQLKAQNPNNVVVSAGDLIGASPLVSALFHDEGTIETMNRLGLEFNAVGNHEFDEGGTELLRMQRGGCHPTDRARARVRRSARRCRSRVRSSNSCRPTSS